MAGVGVAGLGGVRSRWEGIAGQPDSGRMGVGLTTRGATSSLSGVMAHLGSAGYGGVMGSPGGEGVQGTMGARVRAQGIASSPDGVTMGFVMDPVNYCKYN